MFQGARGRALSDWLAIAVSLLCFQVAIGTEEMHDRRKVLPRDNQYCGIDSLYVFLKTAGVGNPSLSQLEESLPPTPRGVSVANIAKYCEDNGFSVRVVRTTLDGLRGSQLPAVLHVN